MRGDEFEKRLRRAEQASGSDARSVHNQGVPPCPKCGRKAGQMAMLTGRAGSVGCEHCVGGLPGELPVGPITSVRVVNAPTREEIEAQELDRELREFQARLGEAD